MGLVDVGVVTHGTREISVDALTRLLANSGDIPVRLLVHDNTSEDGTPDAIAASIPQAEVEVSPQNLGFAAGMNRLLARSSAPWFLALNSDAWPEPGAIAALLAAGEADRRIGAVAPRIERPGGELEHSTYPFPSLRVAAITALGGYRRLWPATSRRLALVGAWHHDVARDVDWAIGAALLMRRAAVDAVGGFDESFFMYAEDLEWCWRARAGGWVVRFEPAAVVRHVGNASGARTYGALRTRAHTHNSYRFYRRAHGAAATAAYHALNIAGYSRLYLLSRLRRDEGGRAEWATHVRAHLSRIPAGGDRPPAPAGGPP